LDELKAAEKALGQYRTVFMRQDQVTGRQNFLPNAKLFRIIGDSDGPRSVYPVEQWNPQTELFFSNVAVGKTWGGAFFLTILTVGGVIWSFLEYLKLVLLGFIS
jgi:hypothetical protein